MYFCVRCIFNFHIRTTRLILQQVPYTFKESFKFVMNESDNANLVMTCSLML